LQGPVYRHLSATSRKGAAKRNVGRDRSSMDESLRLGLRLPSMRCAKPSSSGRAKSLRGENIRKNWVYTPADWKSQLVIRRKSLYHGITRPSLPSLPSRKAPAFRPGISGDI